MPDYVPNMLRCAKCNFELERLTLNANTGEVGIGTNEPERCPNGCGPLWRVTWEQEAQYLGRRMNEWADRAIAAEKRLADALGVLRMVDDNHRVDAGERRKAWRGPFVVSEVRRVLEAPAGVQADGPPQGWPAFVGLAYDLERAGTINAETRAALIAAGKVLIGAHGVSLLGLAQNNGVVPGVRDVDERIPVPTARAEKEAAVVVDLGLNGSEHDGEAAAPTSPHDANRIPDVNLPDGGRNA